MDLSRAIEWSHVEARETVDSAAMIDLVLPFRGYKPRGNYQAEFVTEIRRRLQDLKLLEALRVRRRSAPAR